MIKNKFSIILGEKRMKVADISKHTGISNNTLYKIYHNKSRGIDFETLDKLCWALECNSQELFEYIPNQSTTFPQAH